MRRLVYFTFVGVAILLAHLTAADDTYTLGRGRASAGNADRYDSQASVEDDDATEDESEELAAKQNSADDDVVIRDSSKKSPIRRSVQWRRAASSSPLPQKDYDDYSSEDPIPFVDLDAIGSAITDLHQQPITGMFKPADSNDWFIVERHLHHYYANEMGRALDKENLWQPAKEDTEGLNFGFPRKSGANIKF